MHDPVQGLRGRTSILVMSKDLQEYRQEIDRIDDEILRLLNERSKSVIEIGKLKKLKDSEAHLHTPASEAEIIDRLTKHNTGPFPTDAIRPLYREIMSASLSLEGPQKVAYLGPRATFTHMACMQKFGASAQYVPVNSIKEVFSEVERGRANFGVVPIENTTEGVVNHTLDMFIDSNLLIYGEVLQEVAHHLAVEERSDRRHYEDFIPIPMPLRNVATGWKRIFLTCRRPRWPVRRVRQNCASMIPRLPPSPRSWPAQLYGLKVITARIEDNINNFTRFLVLSQKPPERTGRDKTSLMLSIKDKVGALYDLLRPFASHGLNMTKIESRPSRRKAWEYIFFVDIEGHIDEERVKKAMEEVKSRCLFMKILGSYPAHS